MSRVPLSEPIELPFELPTGFYSAMVAIWQLRPGLQRKFPLHRQRQKDYVNYLGWCALHGRREYALLRSIPAWEADLARPVVFPGDNPGRWDALFTRGMYLIGLARSRYWAAALLEKSVIRDKVARWYFRAGRQELGMAVPQWQAKRIRQQFGTPAAFREALESAHETIEENAVESAMDADTETREAEPAALTPARAGVAARWLAGSVPLRVARLNRFREQLRRRPNVREIEGVTELIPPTPRVRGPKSRLATQNDVPRPYGVNLYGYARGDLGIGEDVRALARALDAAGVPFGVINIEPGRDVSQSDRSVEEWITEEPRYAVNIFCMTGIEMSRLVSERGPGILEGYYNIGLWPWELPEWPRAWHHAWELVDELWAISSYVARSYAKAPVPVNVMPLPVTIDEPKAMTRADWGLPKEAYLFLFSFDMNSWIPRKNPEALIRAFRKAFPDPADDSVGLVLKVSHVDESQPAWKRLKKLIGGDPRVYLFTEEFSRPVVLSLYQQCDCFVSLHRAEGFGRGIAEAMLLGLDIVATGFSGNMDYSEQPDIERVNYQMIRVGEGEYFYGDDQYWAEPDIEDAAARMRARAALGRPASPERASAPGYNVERFLAQYCGAIYRDRLDAIMNANAEHGLQE